MPRLVRPGSTPISIYLPSPLHRAVKARAALEGISLETLIVQTLQSLIASDPRYKAFLESPPEAKKKTAKK